MPDSPTVSIVVPTYNEARCLPDLLQGLTDRLLFPYEVIVVDDGSPDGTAFTAREASVTHPVRVIDRGSKLGIGSAIRAGVREARADIVAVMDADLSHDPRFLSDLVEVVLEGADLALGSRYVTGGEVVGWGPYRRLVSGVGNGLARGILGVPAKDATTGYRVYGPRAKPIIARAISEGYAFQIEVLHLARRARLTIAERPIRFENRRDGKSKLGTSEFVAFLATLARLRLAR